MPAASPTLVLGGGPAGCAAAITLARAGQPVILIEREREPRHKVCGEFLSAEALTLLAGLGIPLAESRHPHPVVPTPIRSVRLASGRHLVETALPFPAQSLTRRCLDALLLQAAEQAGVQVLRGAPVEALSREGNRWHARLQTGDIVIASSAILATGKHDIRGLPRPAGVQGNLVAMKMYWRLAPGQAHELGSSVELHLHPEGYTGLQPVEGDIANLTCLVSKRRLARLGGWEGLLRDLRHASQTADRRLAGADPLLPRPLAISSIPYGFVRRDAIDDGLWAVGDQAAVIPSLTGDGMSIALFSGVAAARGMLTGETASAFQNRLHGLLRWQVARATLLSRALVHSPWKSVLVTGARLWPGSVRETASLTRVSKRALNALRPAF